MSDKSAAIVEAARQRRLAFEAGRKSADEHVAVLRHELQRWRLEAEWWKAEYYRVHGEHCDFVLDFSHLLFSTEEKNALGSEPSGRTV